MSPSRSLCPWWQCGIIYQLYSRSFQDGDGDGIGDLAGITSCLDYLAALGVDALWLTPVFPSPMKDFGYDITDYTGIDPVFGTMEEFDRLLAETHRRGLKLLLDLVPNHTSELHPWFLESRRFRHSPKRDWYVWRDPAPGGGPPNNWLSVFGGPAWTLDPGTGQYYLHQFLREQPDLNYRNPAVLEAMLGVMRFWLDRGVDGFRVDVINRIVEDALFRDEPPDPNWDGVDPFYSLAHIHTGNQPETHEVLRQMRVLVDRYPDRVMVGEVYATLEEVVTYYGGEGDECHFPFNFQLITMRWDPPTLRRAIAAYEDCLPDDAWPSWVLGNHDRRRVASRMGNAQARVANMLLLTLRGTPTTYYGEEIGMEDVPIPPEFVQDPPAFLQPEIAHLIGRDPVRTPMQWDDGPNAGFAPPGAVPWLPLAGDYRRRNVAAQEADPRSMLALYRALAHLRRREPALNSGIYHALETGQPDMIAYLRAEPGADSFLVVLNLVGGSHLLELSGVGSEAEVTVSTGMNRAGTVSLSQLAVGPNEGLVLRLGPSHPAAPESIVWPSQGRGQEWTPRNS